MLKSSRKLYNIIGVYRIYCHKTSKSYVGASVSIGDRLYDHIGSLSNNFHHSKQLQTDFSEFGKSAFDVYIEHTFETIELNELLNHETMVWEKHHPKLYNTNKPKIINLTITPKEIPDLNDKCIKRFWANVTAKSPTDCWEWQGVKNNQGYGSISYQNKHYYAHRISFYIHNDIPPGELLVLHKCDNPPCVNPNHLFLGTNRDNTMDRVQKRRGKNIKWTEEMVQEARNLYSHGLASLEDLRHRFGVSDVYPVITNRIWHDASYDPPKFLQDPVRNAYIQDLILQDYSIPQMNQVLKSAGYTRTNFEEANSLAVTLGFEEPIYFSKQRT